jgi:uncharacterized protein (TIGR03085 family)
MAVQEQGAGVPLLAGYFLFFPIMAVAPNFRDHLTRLVGQAMRRTSTRGFDKLVSGLEGGPPRLFRSPVVGPVRLFENWIHHEDVRRAGPLAPRPSDPDTDVVLWSALWAMCRYQRPFLDGLRLELRERSGQSRAVGRGETVVVSGTIGELALFLGGRRNVAEVELAGDSSAIARLDALGLRV